MSKLELSPQEMLRLVRWTVELNQHLPKKYREPMSHLMNAYREVLYTRQISIPAGELGLRWQCAVADLPKLLDRMTLRSQGRVTYSIGPGTPGVGTTVQLRFAVQEGERQHDTSSPRE
jgi:hypothetical protein